MIRTAITLILVSTTCASAYGQSKADKADLKMLQAKWQVTAIIYEGKDLKTDKASVWTINGNKIQYPMLNSKKEFDEFKLDASKKPKAMDVRVVRDKKKDQKLKAIYMLKKDQLIICVDLSNKGRPTAFTSKKGSGRRLITLKRLKSK